MGEPARPLHYGEAWPAQGHWTYADYLRLPDDGRRYEVIRGHLYVTPAPNFDHQFVLWRFGQTLGRFVDLKGLGIVLSAPFDVLLPTASPLPSSRTWCFYERETSPGSVR